MAKIFSTYSKCVFIAKCLDPKWKLHEVHKISDMYYGCLCDLEFSQFRDLSLTRGEGFELNLPNVRRKQTTVR